MSDIFPPTTIRSYAQKSNSPNSSNMNLNILEDSNNRVIDKLKVSPTSNSNILTLPLPTTSSSFTSPPPSGKSNFSAMNLIGGPCNICKVDKSPLWEESNGIIYCKDCFKKVVDRYSSQTQLPPLPFHRPPFSSSPNSQQQNLNLDIKSSFKPYSQSQPQHQQKSYSYIDDENDSHNFPPMSTSHSSSHQHGTGSGGSEMKQESYYCKYCEKNFPSSRFKNIQSFGAHCSNCSRKRKSRDDGFSFVPEMTNYEPHSSSTSSSNNPPFKFIKRENDFDDIEYTYGGSGSHGYNLGSDDIHRLPYSSPHSPQQVLYHDGSSSPLTSPRGNLQIDDGSLRFGLLDVIEDKIAEENILDLIRKDLKNIGNEIKIQDIRMDKDISNVQLSLSNDLKETESRMLEDINSKTKQDEKLFIKLREEFLSQYVKLEKELNDLIETKKKLQREEKDHLNESNDELKIDEDDHSDSLPIDQQKSQPETSTIDQPEQQKTKINQQGSNIIIQTSSISSSSNSSSNINSNSSSRKEKEIKKNNYSEDDLEIIRKIEQIKKEMNEAIISISLNFTTQGRELERLVSLESKENEKHLTKKLDDLKIEINENPTALYRSFEFLDNILLQPNFNVVDQKKPLNSSILSIFN
ncbi:hypothetical protein DLAC_06770 [Tieghemostelium lacteum]|uniref:GATA-binding transcription factor n=1 Tax=Tieghemostelium lacteum TaxID=361077 RepID=A0A151ZEA1_TIELA|nr:hypothetical protein DLAC_06770 [Tieghemostelium lacteum]|eukprot:KYQ92286.1 hypothetical protein DLAC_06770 [Tieghemostelium lacteum]